MKIGPFHVYGQGRNSTEISSHVVGCIDSFEEGEREGEERLIKFMCVCSLRKCIIYNIWKLSFFQNGTVCTKSYCRII